MNIGLAGSCEHTQLLNVPFRGFNGQTFRTVGPKELLFSGV